MLACCTASFLLLQTSGLTGAFLPLAMAGYDDDRNQREEARRERERERAEREAARKQRQAEREAERAEREREREEARRQRELERQRQEQAREQERQERLQAKAEQRREETSGRKDEPSGDAAAPVAAVPVQNNTQNNSQAANGQTNPGKSWSDSRAGDGDGVTKRASSNSSQGGSKRSEPSRQTEKPREAGKDSPKKESNSDEAVEDDDDVAVPEVEEPPRTLVEWFKRIGDTPAKPARNETGAVSPTAKAPAREEPAPAARSSAPKSAKASTSGSTGSTRAASKTTDATAKKTSQAAVQSTVRRSGFDAELLRLGEVRRHQVLASGLDKAGLEKARAMGFKVTASASSPGSSTPVIALTVPEGMSEGAARDRLEGALPKGRFGPNHVYHIHPAAEVSRAASASQDRAACQGADCLAKSLLDWKPALSACAAGVKIGVIDTSFDMSHPALKSRSHDLKDFRSSPMAAKSDWHGTAVLSVLAGDSQSATPGIVPDAHFLLAATFGAGPDGQASADAVSVLAALSWLDGKADIINMSFSGPRNEEIELAIRAMAVKGVVFVAAAGNRGPNGPASYPAAYSEVIAVTAVAHDRRGYRHATHGDYIDVAAPGVDVTAALPLGKSGLRTGTSFAAPFVTGLLAAMPAVRRGAMTKSDLMARISTDDLGEPGRDPVFGEGLPRAPARCDEIGGVASLPWTPEAQRMSLGGTARSAASGSGRIEPVAESAMGWAMGFAP